MTTFLDKDYKVDETLFEKLKVKSLTTWEELELRCAMSGVELDEHVFAFILVGSLFSDDLFKLVLHAFETPCIDKFFETVEMLELIYKVYSPLEESRPYSGLEAWLEFASLGTMDLLRTYSSSGLLRDNQRRYKLLTLVDAKFPLIVIEFFDKHQRELAFIDKHFAPWLIRKWSKRTSPQAKQIHAALLALQDNERKLCKFMN